MVLNRPVRLSTAVLLTIGIFDLLTTMLLMQVGMREGNPIFGALASFGPLAFALGKLLFLIGPVLLLEYARERNPSSAEQGTWIAASAYFAMYGGHLASLLR